MTDGSEIVDEQPVATPQIGDEDAQAELLYLQSLERELRDSLDQLRVS